MQKCYHRFDVSFIGINPQQNENGNNAGHKENNNNMTTMVASQPEYVDETCPFPDSRVTNHVTYDLGNLTIGLGYSGTGKIHMGNGQGLPISHIGHTSFFSSQ